MFPRGWQCLAGGTQVGPLKVKGFNARKRPTGMLVPARLLQPSSSYIGSLKLLSASASF